MDTKQRHVDLVERIREQLTAMRGEKSAPLCLQNHNHSSNVTRPPSYKEKGRQLDINKLDRILSIDLEKKVIVVEPRVTMEELAKATLKHGVMVPVLPEFKGITVGGAIMGAGIESSSHRYGIFSDTCLAYEILLGDGTVVRASPDENADLFYAVVGSYGSLGILLSAEFPLVPVKPWVKVTYRTFHSLDETIAHIQAISNHETSPEFIEGLAFSKNHQIVIEGDFLSEEEAKEVPATFRMNHTWSPWFYCHARTLSHAQDISHEKIPLYDYLFRHDRGAFWIGGYGTYSTLLLRYFLENRLHMPWISRLFPPFSRKDLKGPQDPNAFFRYFLGWAMSSQRLYAWLHARSEEWVARRSVIQDCGLPASKVVPFMERVFDEIDIFPLWLCPTPPTKHPQIFSPHYLPSCQEDLLINVGVYGISPKKESAPKLTQKLEEWTEESGGRKALYSHSYYTKEKFWEIYSKEAYENLRHTYHADPWTEIDTKALSIEKN